ncbi:SusC/RagA family TonB-linked outer membrane protein [Chitinophaga oryziterrae]|uniref:SusC/RagA family TonB-linked outer membrane protein n=1 Tax=Chitinophaga oryziterrae TaxID=1031224 RepID=A0A6N8J3P0_9BACT|nr:TonB-dependent receptor [Chitinophaga oryziterrae]MVT39835.1 SusC/RagA family TonB-linked outer membrane protein [Chitinophaga oryziterrae]
MKKRVTFLTACLFMLCSFAMAQQDITVKGHVQDKQGTSLPGVSVKIKGTNRGTITQADGNFSIEAPSTGTLEISYVGYEGQNVVLNGRTQLNISLADTKTDLSEVVVIGYGTQKKKDVTTAVVSVSTKDIGERPITQTAAALQGKAAGVQVTQPSGKPGAAFSVRVRGATSVQAGNEPLYVIDGVPTSDTRDLNPNDIENITVLKDASSAAIYGARASNGVVLITTKRGKSGAGVINFNTYYGVSNVGKKINVLNPTQYNDLMKDLGYATTTPTETTDWLKEVFKTGHNQNYQLSMSGGSEKSQYFVSGAVTKDDGMVKPAQYNRYSFRTNLDNQLKDWLKVSTNISYSNVALKDLKDNDNAGRNAAILGALNAPPIMGIYETDADGHRRYTMNPYKAGWDNPMAAIEGPTQGTGDNRVLGNASADINLTKSLKFRSNFGVDYFSHKYDYYLDYIMTTPGRNDHGYASSQKTNSFTYLWENTLNYDKKWNKHSLSALGGVTTQKNKYNESNLTGRDFPADPTVKTLNAANQIVGDTYESQWFLMSYLGRVMYNYDSKYLVTANFRADGSSKLDKKHKWGYFPSVSAGWRISAEPFMKDVKEISDLKIRAGWGQNGNQEGLDPYAAYGLNTYTRQTATSPLSGPVINPSKIAPNPDLKWETTTQTNVGIDLSMFDSRLTFTADAYIKKTSDLLLNVTLPPPTGYDYITRNSGSLENKGLEFVVSSVNVDKKDLKWSTDFNIAFNRNKITDLQLSKVYYYASVENRDNIIILQKGLALGTFYGYVSEGVDPQTGNIRYKDVNGDGNVTPQDRTVIGSAQPKFTYGLNNNIDYKNWSLSFLLQGSQGNKVFNASRMETEGMYDSKNQSTEVLRRWTTPGQVTDIPKATNGDVTNSRTSSRFVENGSFLRMKSTTLSYKLPESAISRLHLNKLMVYATAQNLFTITKYKGFDPEVNAFATNANNGVTLGIDYGTYPVARTFIVGLNLQF